MEKKEIFKFLKNIFEQKILVQFKFYEKIVWNKNLKKIFNIKSYKDICN